MCFSHGNSLLNNNRVQEIYLKFEFTVKKMAKILLNHFDTIIHHYIGHFGTVILKNIGQCDITL